MNLNIFHSQIKVNYMYEYVKFMDIAGRPILSQVVDQFLNVLEKKKGMN